ncbi:hypothetical protein ACHHV8_26140 [Paenibacillus sp. TAB 01]
MKKVFVLITALVLLFSATGCGKSPAQGGAADSGKKRNRYPF